MKIKGCEAGGGCRVGAHETFNATASRIGTSGYTRIVTERVVHIRRSGRDCSGR